MNLTKQALRDALMRMLSERPLSQITVKDIVTECGVNRNTFYYYFSDIPALIEDTVRGDAEALIAAYPTVEKLDDCLRAVIASAQAKKKAVLHIYNSVNRELYEQYLWQICDHVIEAYVTTVLKGRRISDSDLYIIKKYLSSLGFGIVSGWLKSGMTDDVDAMLTRLSQIKAGMVEEMIARCEMK